MAKRGPLSLVRLCPSLPPGSGREYWQASDAPHEEFRSHIRIPLGDHGRFGHAVCSLMHGFDGRWVGARALARRGHALGVASRGMGPRRSLAESCAQQCRICDLCARKAPAHCVGRHQQPASGPYIGSGRAAAAEKARPRKFFL